MKKALFVIFIIAPVLSVFGQQAYEAYDITNWNVWGDIPLNIEADDLGILVSGMTDKRASGYVIETKTSKDIGLEGKTRIKLKISGVNTKKDKYDQGKLVKLELNSKPVVTITKNGSTRNDRDFVVARNGEYEFDISQIRNIRKIEFVFFHCEISGVKIEMFVR